MSAFLAWTAIIFFIGFIFVHTTREGVVEGLVVALISADGPAPRLTAGKQESGASRVLGSPWLPRVAYALAFTAIRAVVTNQFDSKLYLFALIGLLAGELHVRSRARRRASKASRHIELHLPMVMERVVMGVSSGLDIIPALAQAARKGSNEVSKSFRQIVSLAEGGLPVDEAFRTVSREAHSAPLKHALVHLSLAHQQGGEVIRPLRELSDATQLHYQDRIEEDLAKLPVKGILPLVLTFAGLIICFLTIPLVQVGAISTRVVHETK